MLDVAKPFLPSRAEGDVLTRNGSHSHALILSSKNRLQLRLGLRTGQVALRRSAAADPGGPEFSLQAPTIGSSDHREEDGPAGATDDADEARRLTLAGHHAWLVG